MMSKKELEHAIKIGVTEEKTLSHQILKYVKKNNDVKLQSDSLTNEIKQKTSQSYQNENTTYGMANEGREDQEALEGQEPQAVHQVQEIQEYKFQGDLHHLSGLFLQDIQGDQEDP